MVRWVGASGRASAISPHTADDGGGGVVLDVNFGGCAQRAECRRNRLRHFSMWI